MAAQTLPPPPLPVIGPLCALQENAAQGRFVVARPDLPSAALAAGTAVCESPAYAVSVMETWRKRACARCFSVAAKRLECRCTACDQAWYCSEACRDEHAAHGSPGTSRHVDVCPALATLTAAKQFGKGDVAMVRLMVEIVAREQLGPATNGKEEEAAAGTLRFDHMQRHPPDWGDSERRDWAKLFTVLENALTQCEWYAAAPSPSPTAAGELAGSAPTSRRDWQHMLSRIDSNVFGCFSSNESGQLFGQGMYLEGAMFNHSCDPNCAVSTTINPLQVVTTRAVLPGEELTIAYVDTTQPRSARRAKLAEGYRFACACPRCSSEDDALTAVAGAPPSATPRCEKKGAKGKGTRTKAELRARREERQRAAAAAAEQRQQRRMAQRTQDQQAPTPAPAHAAVHAADGGAAAAVDETWDIDDDDI